MRRAARPAHPQTNALTTAKEDSVVAVHLTSAMTTVVDPKVEGEAIRVVVVSKVATSEEGITMGATSRTAGGATVMVLQEDNVATTATSNLEGATISTTKDNITREALGVTAKDSHRHTIKATTTRVTTTAATASTQVTAKLLLLYLLPLGRPTTSSNRPTTSNISSMHSSGSSITRTRANGISTTTNVGTTARVLMAPRAHSRPELVH